MKDQEVQTESVSIDDAAPVTEGVSPDTAPDTDERDAQITELNDKILRLAAELENTRRRAALDAQSRARAQSMSVAEKILPVMDAIDAALKHNPDDTGIQSMARAMDAAFAQIGITRIESVGHVMNPQFHNAIQVVDTPGDTDRAPAPNTIVEELQSGYMFGDTVLRTAMVIVCK